ncbi:hypothetical protein BDZ89DRAFT_1066647 [Hymenopellis radicata]|nr:hypothetical protein BDZ89DRAFT_1066647 [Hymenopellis radicata]
MGQYWDIFNLDKQICIGSLGKFPEFFLGGSEAAAIDPLEGQPYKDARKYRYSRTGICDLPCELQDAIFAELCNPIDVFAFSLTASHFWRIGISHFKALYSDYVRHAKDWSGDRLICLGDSADGCPEGLITDEVLENLEDSYLHHFGSEAGSISSLLDVFSQRLRDVQWPSSWEFRWRCALNRRNPLARRAKPKRKVPSRWNLAPRLSDSGDPHVDSSEDDELGNDLPEYLPLYKYDFSAWLDLPEPLNSHDRDTPCILRNLTKKVYVRDDALALRKDDANEDDDDDEEDDAKTYYMSFGSLVVLRIAWSSHLSLCTADDGDLCRGIWAGDRFDIVNIDAIEHEEGWTDVSTAAREQLCQIWTAVFGVSRWEAEVREMGL